MPTSRGFNSFYGFYHTSIDYYTKKSGDFLDLHDNDHLVTDKDELSDGVHSAHLFQRKAEKAIKDHVTSNHSSKPLFLYYSLQLVHSPYQAPMRYIERCAEPSATSATTEDYTYCAMNLMLDEVVANLTCTLDTFGMLNNTVLIMTSDNGGAREITGSSVPFRGHKYDLNRGGISANAFITSSLIPPERRGAHYSGQMHVTDWLPTIMSIATNGQWSAGYTGNEIDGVNMWDAILTDATSPRTEIVHYVDSSGRGSIQIDMKKLDTFGDPAPYDEVSDYFVSDLAPGNLAYICETPYWGDKEAEQGSTSQKQLDSHTDDDELLITEAIATNKLIIVVCEPGFWLNSWKECVECPAGTFSADHGSTCLLSPPGALHLLTNI